MTQTADTSRQAAGRTWADDAEQRVLDEAVRLAPKAGWNTALVSRALAAAGLSDAEGQLLLPEGPRDLAALLSRRHDAAALGRLQQLDLAALKMRQRIREGVVARLDAAQEHADVMRPLAAFLAFPTNLALALRLTWESADMIWRWAGDTATDENHYSKRAILSGILISTIAVDLASGRTSALTHLDARIDNVMAFEKWKATTKLKPSQLAAEVAGALGKLRYGAA